MFIKDNLPKAINTGNHTEHLIMLILAQQALTVAGLQSGTQTNVR